MPALMIKGTRSYVGKSMQVSGDRQLILH